MLDDDKRSLADGYLERRTRRRMLRSLQVALWALIVICTALLLSGAILTRTGALSVIGVELCALVLLVLLAGERRS